MTEHESDPAVQDRPLVLLVEDDAAVRALARRILEACGCMVLESGDGAEACELVCQHAGTIRLLVADVVLPRMNGRELADRLTATQPALPVLFLSGYTNEALIRMGIFDGAVPLIEKPFSLKAFAARVRELLVS